jgi:hypothetical protein
MISSRGSVGSHKRPDPLFCFSFIFDFWKHGPGSPPWALSLLPQINFSYTQKNTAGVFIPASLFKKEIPGGHRGNIFAQSIS